MSTYPPAVGDHEKAKAHHDQIQAVQERREILAAHRAGKPLTQEQGQALVDHLKTVSKTTRAAAVARERYVQGHLKPEAALTSQERADAALEAASAAVWELTR